MILLTADGVGAAEIMRRTGKSEAVVRALAGALYARVSTACCATIPDPRASRRWARR